jgi:hypothetical protein
MLSGARLPICALMPASSSRFTVACSTDPAIDPQAQRRFAIVVNTDGPHGVETVVCLPASGEPGGMVEQQASGAVGVDESSQFFPATQAGSQHTIDKSSDFGWSATLTHCFDGLVDRGKNGHAIEKKYLIETGRQCLVDKRFFSVRWPGAELSNEEVELVAMAQDTEDDIHGQVPVDRGESTLLDDIGKDLGHRMSGPLYALQSLDGGISGDFWPSFGEIAG